MKDNDIETLKASNFLGINKKKTTNDKTIDYDDFDWFKIGIASPQKIKNWSYGEVKKSETINYRTLKPEKDGLLCQRIFGPIKDYECECGKYRWIKYKNVICDRCGVEVTESKVRRERMGHIELAAPVVHIWYLRKSPSKIGLLLDMKPSDLEKIVYYAAYVIMEDVVDPVTNKIEFKKGDIILEEQLNNLRKNFPKVKAGIGAGAIKDLLSDVDLEKEINLLVENLKNEKNFEEKNKLVKRLQALDSFYENQVRPEWMVMTVLPVIPPDLRPLVPLDGGRFASSDLNDLYRRIINRNNRLKHIEALRAPQVMIFNEKRLLQEAVDALIENGARGKSVTSSTGRPLKSLSDVLKGKQGRFRQNLLGKRVDYSGRSVIVIGPNLKLNQCGIPKDMALELFKPFVLSELIKKNDITLKVARKKIETPDDEVWDILEKVTKRHLVLLNRAPTLHRVSIQAFEPVLIEGLAIQLHPLVCAAFNADFDGDQMAVHVPLSPNAQIEARALMMSTNNILSPASGKPLASPSHDMILGANYLTKVKYGENGSGKFFSDFDDALAAYERKILDIHAPIKVKGFNEFIEKDNEKFNIKDCKTWKDYTTVGRIIFFHVLPKEINIKDYNKPVGKKDIVNLIDYCYKSDKIGPYKTIQLLDNLVEMGFHYSTLSGLSISIADMKIPPEKGKLIKEAEEEVRKINGLAEEGIITDAERYNQVINKWTEVSEKVSNLLFAQMANDEKSDYDPGKSRFNSVFMMADSGARGSRQQVRQLCGMRGLMAKPQKRLTGGIGEIIENPITSNFREGLTVLEYFISTHGGRKGLSDTALKTADAGYLTRRLVDVAHNVVVTIDDCGTSNGVYVDEIKIGDDIIEPLEDRVVGRIAQEDVKTDDGEVIVKAGEYINSDKAKQIKEAGIEKVFVRSVLTCEAEDGVCSKCFGINLATNKEVAIGEAVGIIAAQSIGEPGTQLTLRTFHIGGTASAEASRSEIKADRDGDLEFKNMDIIEDRNGERICVSRSAIAIIKSNDKKSEIKIPYGSRIEINAKKVKKGDVIGRTDPHTMPIITRKSGKVRYADIDEGKTLHMERNKVTGIIEKRVIEHRGKNVNPRIEILENGKVVDSYLLPVNCIIVVDDGENLEKGDIIAKMEKSSIKTKDITGGLPRVAELFEVRKPQNPAIITKIEGIVKLSQNQKGQVVVEVRNEETGQVESYDIPFGKHLMVYDGDRVIVGESLTDGAVDIYDLLDVKGIGEVQSYLVNAIQEVYRSQGVNINDKYIEVIVRQMLSNVRITSSGASSFIAGEVVSKAIIKEENKKLKEKGLEEASYEPVLLGISKASLSSESFISAASFQETTKILTESAVLNKMDYLKGLKENVIIGRLVPCGTGLATRNQNLKNNKDKKEE
ncbi:MAG: DNA-directed RNA polymerase subunit beta' [Elusimicrobia bacterium]|jgi:DNA-directed RNA polymerase subunit beta'|nr:DNA-directed RNA polymerase subunit beta' [Elusimicrobiota bacterium]